MNYDYEDEALEYVYELSGTILAIVLVGILGLIILTRSCTGFAPVPV